MQENKFEKRLQQEMEEFKLRPSDAVWEKVEEQLRKKKKRRFAFFIFMLAGLSLLGYSGYFLTTTNSNQNLVQQENNSLPGSKKSESVNKIPQATTIETPTAKGSSSIKDYQLPLVSERNNQEQKAIIVENDMAGKPEEKTKRKSSGNYVNTKSAGRSNSDNTKDNNQAGKTGIKQTDNPSNYPLAQTNISQPVISENNLQTDNITNDQKENSTSKTDSVIIADSKSDEVMVATKKKQGGSKIKWGIDLSAGISSSRNNAFSLFDMQKSADMLYSSPVNNTGGGGGFGIPRIYPSEVKAGPAFRAGLVGEMKVSKRSSVSSGLQYVYYSNKIKVGYYYDTTVVVNNSFSQASRVGAVYMGTHQKEYTNHYQLIQIPLQYEWQLNKGVKLPIRWSIGVSAGYLFATNGLVYDTAAGGIYYRSTAAFNKFQFNLSTGFSFRFGNKNNLQWSLGPELSMGMNKLMKDDYTKKQYLLYGGVTGRLFFKKRNNK